MMGYAFATFELGKNYGKAWGLKDATFHVEQGRLAVLVGPNGAGKTTTVKMLVTVLKPSKGRAEVLGMDVVKDCKRIRKRIAYFPQGFMMNLNLTPEGYIKWNLMARGFPLSEAKLKADEWVKLMGLQYCRNRAGWTLSGGERRKVVVATALASDADVIFLDEPTAGLDVESRHVVWRLVRDIVAKGTTILLTTHDMKEAEMIADEVIVINEGKVLIKDAPQNLIKSLSHRYKVAVKKGSFKSGFSSIYSIDLGDRLIIYANDSREVEGLISRLNDPSSIISIDSVGLEDVYLHLIHGG